MAGTNSPTRAEDLQRFKIASLPPDFYYIPNFLTPEEETSILQKIPSQRWTHLTHRRLQAHPSTLTPKNTLLAASLPAWLTTPIIDRFERLDIFEKTPHKRPNHVLINEYRPGEGIMPHEDGGAYAHVVATVSLGASICLDICEKANTYDTTISTSASASASTSEPPNGNQTRHEGGAANEDFSADDLVNASHKEYNLPTRILQEPRSLLLTTGPAYTNLLHGISPVSIDENLNAETVANWHLLGDESVFEKEGGGGRNVRGTRISLTYRDVIKVSMAASKVFGGMGRR